MSLAFKDASAPVAQGLGLLLLNISLGLGTFIQVLDISIANVALPYIAGNLGVSPNEGTWVITSFAVSNAIVLPLTGWLSDYFGRVRLFVYSVLLFSLASFFCGFSYNLGMLVFFRVLQGAVAGSLIPLSQSLILLSNPHEKQGQALGFWAMTVVIAPILGPIIGGYLTDTFSWPWIFYINIPIGIFVAFVVWHMLKGHESDIVRHPIDWIGLSLLALGLACLQLMLDSGQGLGWFDSHEIVALGVIAFVALSYFALWTFYQKHPIVDFSFLKERNFALGTLGLSISFLLFFGSTVTLPLWLQTEQGYTAFWAGVAVAPIGIIPFLFSARVGAYLKYLNLRYVASLSLLIFAANFFYVSSFTPQVSLETVMWARFLQGFGLVIFLMPLLQITLANVPKERYASATGLVTFLRILIGSGLGLSLALKLWNDRANFHERRLLETLRDSRLGMIPTPFDSMGADDMLSPIAEALISRQVEQQAYTMAINDIFWLAAWIYIFLSPLPLFCHPPRKAIEVEPAIE